jgi:hypothetical protein
MPMEKLNGKSFIMIGRMVPEAGDSRNSASKSFALMAIKKEAVY